MQEFACQTGLLSAFGPVKARLNGSPSEILLRHREDSRTSRGPDTMRIERGFAIKGQSHAEVSFTFDNPARIAAQVGSNSAMPETKLCLVAVEISPLHSLTRIPGAAWVRKLHLSNVRRSVAMNQCLWGSEEAVFERVF